MTPKRLLHKASEPDKKIHSITQAAAKLFSSKGYVQTSMEEVAAEARMSKSLLYYYFRDKSDILDYILSSFLDSILQNTQEHLQKVENPTERLRVIILEHVRTYCDHPYLAKTLLNEAFNLPSTKLRKIKIKEREYYKLIFQSISSYSQDKIDKDEVTALTFTLLGMCNWIYAWYNPKGRLAPEQLSHLIFGIFTGLFWKEV
jgi:AcrR family transcriptional regulator